MLSHLKNIDNKIVLKSNHRWGLVCHFRWGLVCICLFDWFDDFAEISLKVSASLSDVCVCVCVWGGGGVGSNCYSANAHLNGEGAFLYTYVDILHSTFFSDIHWYCTAVDTRCADNIFWRSFCTYIINCTLLYCEKLSLKTLFDLSLSK